MKKYIFAIAAIAMILATSCSKETVNEPEPLREPNEGEFLAVIDSEAIPQNVPAKIGDGMRTKTYFDGNSVYWKTGDEITINGETYTCSVTGHGTAQASAIFSPAGGSAVTAPYNAFYGPMTDISGTNGKLSSDRVYDPDNNASNLPMYAQSNDQTLVFHNICGLLRIVVPVENANKVVVTTTTNNCGVFSVQEASGKKYAALTDATGTADNTITTHKQDNSAFQSGDTVYVAMPQGSYAGLNIQFMNNTDLIWQSGASANSYTINANEIHSVPFNFLMMTGVFSVSATKKVRFAVGNLYYNSNNKYCGIELTQDTYLAPGAGKYNANHVGHFYFADDIINASASESSSSASLFCDESHPLTVNGITGFYCLSKEEWVYLIGDNAYNTSIQQGLVPVGGSGKNAPHTTIAYKDFGGTVGYVLIVSPDNLNTTPVPDKSSVEEYTQAGYLCLPVNAGYRNTNNIVATDGARFMTSTPKSNNVYTIALKSSGGGMTRNVSDQAKTTGRCIRLAREYTTTTPQ